MTLHLSAVIIETVLYWVLRRAYILNVFGIVLLSHGKKEYSERTTCSNPQFKIASIPLSALSAQFKIASIPLSALSAQFKIASIPLSALSVVSSTCYRLRRIEKKIYANGLFFVLFFSRPPLHLR